MIEPSLAAMGYGLVRVAMTSGRRATLQIMIERLDDLPITLDDCTQISHSVSSLLDVADPIGGGSAGACWEAPRELFGFSPKQVKRDCRSTRWLVQSLF